MIICRKCQRHHADDVGPGPCECGADLTRDGIPLGGGAAAGPSVFDDPVEPTDPFAAGLEPEEAPPPPPETAPPPPTPSPESDPVTSTDHDVAPTTTGADPAPASPVRPDLPPPPSKPKRRAGSFTPGDVASSEPADPPPAAETEPVAAVVSPAEQAEVTEATRRARGVTPDQVLAARDEPDAANVGELPADAPAPVVTSSTSPADATTQPIPAARAPEEGEVACPACREPNLDLRRFCFNCGTKLPTPEYGDEDELTPEMMATRKRSWWSRLTGSEKAQRTARTFSGRARRAGGGKFRYASGLSSRFKMTAIVGVLMAGGGIAALIGPYRSLLDPILDRGTPGSSPDSAELVDADEVEGYPADSAIDDKTETGVAFVFGTPEELAELTVDADAAPDDVPADGDDGESDGDGPEGEGDAPEGEGDAPEGEGSEEPEAADDDQPATDEPTEPGTLVIRFDEPVGVSKLYLALGLPDGEEEGPLLRRPSRVRVCAFANTCSELELADSTSLKEYGVDFGEDVDSIRITPLDVHESDTVTFPLAVISEVRVGT